MSGVKSKPGGLPLRELCKLAQRLQGEVAKLEKPPPSQDAAAKSVLDSVPPAVREDLSITDMDASHQTLRVLAGRLEVAVGTELEALTRAYTDSQLMRTVLNTPFEQVRSDSLLLFGLGNMHLGYLMAKMARSYLEHPSRLGSCLQYTVPDWAVLLCPPPKGNDQVVSSVFGEPPPELVIVVGSTTKADLQTRMVRS